MEPNTDIIDTVENSTSRNFPHLHYVVTQGVILNLPLIELDSGRLGCKTITVTKKWKKTTYEVPVHTEYSHHTEDISSTTTKKVANREHHIHFQSGFGQ